MRWTDTFRRGWLHTLRCIRFGYKVEVEIFGWHSGVVMEKTRSSVAVRRGG